MNLMTVRRRIRAVDEFLRPSRAEDRSIPVLDGGLSPNDALDQFAQVWAEAGVEPDDVVSVAAGLLVSAGATIRLIDPASGAVTAAHDFGSAIGAMASDGGSTVYVCPVGRPVQIVTVGPDGSLAVSPTSGPELSCPTDAALHQGRLFVAEGSSVHTPDDWRRDLMTKGRTGRIIELAADGAGGTARVVADGLAWAGGVAVDPSDDSSLLVTESWRHRIVRIPIAQGAPMPVGRSLPGYPARLAVGVGTDVLVSFLSLRTHLVEFVLREDDYRAEMVATIAPDFWISPTLRFDGERWEPLQIGSMKHLNVTKPWAPPRAYGLVARMAPDGTFVKSWHARVGSPRSGVTGMTISDGRLVAACRGGRMVLTSEKEFGSHE